MFGHFALFLKTLFSLLPYAKVSKVQNFNHCDYFHESTFFLHSCMLWLSNHVRLEVVFLLLVCLFHAKPESSYILKEDFWSHLCSALLVSFLLGNLDYFRVSCSDGQLWYDLMTSHSCGGNLVIWHLPSVLSLMEATVVFFRIQIRVLKTVFDPNSFQQVECKGYSGQNK